MAKRRRYFAALRNPFETNYLRLFAIMWIVQAILEQPNTFIYEQVKIQIHGKVTESNEKIHLFMHNFGFIYE